MNKKRQKIYDKSGGKCWYCGCELKKGWHADHFYPVVRNPLDGKIAYPELDTLQNLVPSCPPCNNFKHSMSIEGYRCLCESQFESIPKYTTGARQLVRLGLLDFTPKKVTFWFESQGIKMPSKFEMVGISEEAEKVRWKEDKQEPDYYISDFGEFMCTLKNYGPKWIAIAIKYDWEELDRIEITNCPDAKIKAAQWAIDLGGRI